MTLTPWPPARLRQEPTTTIRYATIPRRGARTAKAAFSIRTVTSGSSETNHRCNVISSFIHPPSWHLSNVR